MSIDAVRAYLKDYNKSDDIMIFQTSSATVELAAQTLGVVPARIAKTLSFKVNEHCVLVVVAGDVRIDNRLFKSFFNVKAKMLTADEVLIFTGHAIGGVCPFAVPDDVKIYTDISLKRFNTVFPACGSSNSAIELTCDELFTISKSLAWVDLCK